MHSGSSIFMRDRSTLLFLSLPFGISPNLDPTNINSRACIDKQTDIESYNTILHSLTRHTHEHKFALKQLPSSLLALLTSSAPPPSPSPSFSNQP